jgi:hypothetical protein
MASAPQPNLDRTSLTQPEFGLDGGFPTAALNGKWQSEPVKRANGTWSYNVPFKPIGTLARDYMNGTPMLIYRELNVYAHTALDFPTFRYFCHEQASKIYAERKAAISGPGAIVLTGGKRSADAMDDGEEGGPIGRMMGRQKIDKECFFDLEKMAAKIGFMGVLIGPPEPLLQHGRGRTEYGVYSGRGAMNMPLVPWGAALLPNMIDNTVPLLPGWKIFVIAKKIPRSMAGAHKNPLGESCVSLDQIGTVDEKQLTIDLIWYVHPDNLPPPRLTDLETMYLKPNQQPPLMCRQYKEFHMLEKDATAPYRHFDIKDGVVWEIGCITQRVEVTVSPTEKPRQSLSWYSSADMNLRPKMQVFLDPRVVWF